MTVWAVYLDEGYDRDELVGLYVSEEVAKEKVRAIKEHDNVCLYISELDVEA